MTEISDRYRDLAGRFTDKVAGVPDDAWSNPSPCEDWTARDVVSHVVDSSQHFFGLVGLPAPEGPSAGDDPPAAWAATRDAVIAALEDPAVAGRRFEGRSGEQTFERAVGQFLGTDLLIHGWDLARATGQDDRLDPDEAAALLAAVEPMDEMMRSPGAFGPKIEPPAGADAPTRLLSFMGRQV